MEQSRRHSERNRRRGIRRQHRQFDHRCTFFRFGNLLRRPHPKAGLRKSPWRKSPRTAFADHSPSEIAHLKSSLLFFCRDNYFIADAVDFRRTDASAFYEERFYGRFSDLDEACNMGHSRFDHCVQRMGHPSIPRACLTYPAGATAANSVAPAVNNSSVKPDSSWTAASSKFAAGAVEGVDARTSAMLAGGCDAILPTLHRHRRSISFRTARQR